ncbi:MAG TPA: PAS domain S-box protein [Chitinispirillaceae bacterium]|nr:PAS domain S-box protein [Chitinispirillaceae bacterium]
MKKILIIVKDIRIRLQIEQILNQYYEMVIQEQLDPDSELFDLCIVDLFFLDRYGKLVVNKIKTGSFFLPIMVVAEKNDLCIVCDLYGTILDEFILAPITETELKVRVSLLLKLKKSMYDKSERRKTTHEKYLFDQIQRMAHIGFWESCSMHPPWLKWSDGMYRIFGVSKDIKPDADILLQLIHPDDRKSMKDWIDGTNNGKQMNPQNSRIIRPDGDLRFVRGSGKPVFNDAGVVIGSIGIVQDISEQKTVERELVEESNLSKQLVDSLPGIFYLFNREGRYLRWNEQHKIISKYNDEELSKLNPLDFFDGEDKKRVAERIENVFKTGCGSVEAKFITKDGRKIDCYFTGRKIVYNNQLCLIGVGIEISKRKAIEKALYENEQKLRLFIDHAPVCIAMFDREMRFLMVSKKWLLEFRIEEHDIIGKNHYEVFPDLPTDWKDAHKKALNGENVKSKDEYVKNKDGKYYWAKWEVRPWYTVNHSIGGIILFIEDITERKKYEEKLRTSISQKENLLKELHHRTKNNMQIISALLELQAADYADNKDVKKIVKSSQNRIRIMALAHEKLYKSEMLTSIDIKEYLIDVAHLIMVSYECNEEKICLEFDIEKIEFPIDIAIPCGFVVKELLTNSLEHAFPGNRKGKVHIGLHKNNNMIELVFGDNGKGVDPDTDILKSKTLGIKLVIQIIEHQLHGTVKPQVDNGLWWFIRFRSDIYSTAL